MPCKSRADDTPYIYDNLTIRNFRTDLKTSINTKTYYIVILLQAAIRAILILPVKIPDWGFWSIFDRGNPLADGVFGQFSDIMNIELAHYLPAVRFDCFDANMQF